MNKILIVGIGLGGSRYGLELKKQFSESVTSEDSKRFVQYTPELGMINLSQDELEATAAGEIDSSHMIKLGGAGTTGAGKDRDKGFEEFSVNSDTILKTIAGWCDEDTKFIFVTFSMGGGTGSAGGPLVSGLLNTDTFRKMLPNGTSPIVLSIALAPSKEEGILSFGNTLGCLDHMDRLVARKNIGKFFIVRNDYANESAKHENSGIGRKLDFVNTDSVSYLKKYISEIETSRVTCLDMSDRRRGLAQTGLHSLEKFYPDGSSKSPFISPENQPTKMTLAQLPVTISDAIEKDLVRLQHDDFKIGYSESKEDFGIVHRAGCLSMKVLTADYRDHYDTLKVRTRKLREADKGRGDTLVKIDEEKSFIHKEYGEKSSGSAQDINDLLS